MVGRFAVVSRSVSVLRRPTIGQEQYSAFLVFAAYFLGAKLGQYVFFDLHGAPAVVWLPAGIALAAVFLAGARMWLPIACGQLLAALTAGSPLAPAYLLVGVAAAVAQPIAGAWLLRRLGFRGTLESALDAILLIGGSIAIAAISPSVWWAVHALGAAWP